jgi:NitT/TauT family transport system permease protein
MAGRDRLAKPAPEPGVNVAARAAAVAGSRSSGPFGSFLKAHERGLVGLASVLAVIVLWQIAASLHLISNRFFSSPIAVGAAGVEELTNPRFWNDVRVSGFEFVIGYGAAALIGVPLGLAIGWFTTLNAILDPWLSFFYSLPRIALVPVLLLWLGIGILSIIAVVFLGAFFSIMVNTVRGARVVDPGLLKVASSFRAGQSKVFLTVVVPSAIPMILAGLRLGVARALTGIVIGELFAANAGLGHLITLASYSLQIDRVLFATLFLIAIGVISVELIRRFESRFANWRDDLATG